MKITKTNISLLLMTLCLIIFSCNQPTENPIVEVTSEAEKVPAFSTQGKTATLYTTASNSDLRLANMGAKEFSKSSQPFENEISIFVNTSKTFQSFLGIGGAITDASAEVYAKLPEDKQQELLSAYYDNEEGIGYS